MIVSTNVDVDVEVDLEDMELEDIIDFLLDKNYIVTKNSVDVISDVLDYNNNNLVQAVTCLTRDQYEVLRDIINNSWQAY